MTMAAYEPDREWGDENMWQEVVNRTTSGLCVLCRDDQAAPGDDLCADCSAEIMRSLDTERAE